MRRAAQPARKHPLPARPVDRRFERRGLLAPDLELGELALEGRGDLRVELGLSAQAVAALKAEGAL